VPARPARLKARSAGWKQTCSNARSSSLDPTDLHPPWPPKFLACWPSSAANRQTPPGFFRAGLTHRAEHNTSIDGQKTSSNNLPARRDWQRPAHHTPPLTPARGQFQAAGHTLDTHPRAAPTSSRLVIRASQNRSAPRLGDLAPAFARYAHDPVSLSQNSQRQRLRRPIITGQV